MCVRVSYLRPDCLRLFVCTSARDVLTFYGERICAAIPLLGLEIRTTKTNMPSSKQEGEAAAAEQLGSMSLSESAERKDNDTTTAENGTTPTKKLCSACGKKSDTVKKCTACKCVWYCDKECQNKHRKDHRKECKRIKKQLDKRGGKLDVGFELDVGPLGKVPPREECPICMLVLPVTVNLQSYQMCCGQTLCSGCSHQHKNKSREQAVPLTCAFCRTAVPKSDEEILARLRKRVELEDPKALQMMSTYYGTGELGLPVDQAKRIELMRQSANLGCPAALFQLGIVHHKEHNREMEKKYWTEAAEGGDLISRHNLGAWEERNGNIIAAFRHWRLSASAGYRSSMENLIKRFEFGLLHHTDLAETLQAFYRSRAEMNSRDRDQYIRHLKETGKYNEEYNF